MSDAGHEPTTLWHGRFAEGPADALMALSVSLGFDQRLAPEDIEGSRAHVTMLAEVGILTTEECEAILAALDIVASEIDAGTLAFVSSDEDIHTAVERRVTEIAGAAGAKIHTGRSRNDQIATDLRLWTKRAARRVGAAIQDFQTVLMQRAEECGKEVSVPGYTHLQHAQPVLLAHHLLAHAWALSRDVQRWARVVDTADVSSLGAGALAGSSLPLDPDRTAELLGFSARFENSLDAVSDRDFVAEAVFAAALTQVHLSRIGEEVVLWSSAEFGFVQLPDAYATGSSMMPQKKNPDVAELVRGKAGRVIGDLTGLLATLKALPLAYNRDLQEDKEPIFDAVDTVLASLLALTGLFAELTFNADVMGQGADSPYLAATDIAEYLVRAGTPFRDAHAIVGDLVRRALGGEASLADLVTADDRLGADAAALLAPGAAVANRRTPGGGGPEPLGAQLSALRARLALQSQWLAD